MHILIIGGTRFLGYHLTKALLSEGHEITLFNRGRTPDDFGKKVHRIRGDRYDYDRFIKTFINRKYDVVIDMIAYKAEDSRTAVKAFKDGVQHFFHISTAAVYTVTRDFPCPLQEEDFDSPLNPRPKTGRGLWDYGYHKRECEHVFMDAFTAHGFPATRLRLPIIIGEKDYTLRAYEYFYRLLDGQPQILPDGGRNVFTHVYQDDVVRTIANNLINSESFGRVYNLAQQRAVTLRDFVLKSSEMLEIKPLIETIPVELLSKWGLSMTFSPFFNKRPFILDTRRAEEDLGFESMNIDDWLAKTIAWYQHHYRGAPPDNYNLREQEVRIIEAFSRAVDRIKP
jgi:nucleoside-diphosphate-sugar epimerase